MSDNSHDPRPETRVATAVGRGVTNAAIFGGLAYGATHLAMKSDTVATHMTNAVNGVVERAASSPTLKGVTDRVANLHTPNGTRLGSMTGNGRTALMIGGTVAAVTAAIGLVDGWNRASNAKKSWRERVGSESRGVLER